MLITRLICILLQQKFTTPDQSASPSRFCRSSAHKDSSFFRPLKYTVFTCSKVNNAFKRQNSWTNQFQKSSTSFENIVDHITIQNVYIYPVSTVSARNTWDHDPFWHTQTKTKKKKCLHFQSLAANSLTNDIVVLTLSLLNRPKPADRKTRHYS